MGSGRCPITCGTTLLSGTRPAALMLLRDEELEGAGDDAEFDGEASEGLTVDLRVDGIRIEWLADEGVGFEEFDAGCAAKFVEVEGGKIAEITETAARGESQDFEAVFEEVGFGGDFEWAAVVLRTAD